MCSGSRVFQLLLVLFLGCKGRVSNFRTRKLYYGDFQNCLKGTCWDLEGNVFSDRHPRFSGLGCWECGCMVCILRGMLMRNPRDLKIRSMMQGITLSPKLLNPKQYLVHEKLRCLGSNRSRKGHGGGRRMLQVARLWT